MSAERIHHAAPSIDRSDIYNEHGIYTFDDDNVTIVSQPSFHETLEAIADQSPNETTILTPELALLGDNELDAFLTDEKYRAHITKDLHRRFKQLKKVSRGSSNTVLMGMPLDGKNGTYYNGMSVVEDGKVLHMQRKANPGMYEYNLGTFEFAEEPEVYHRLGATALICSELIYTSRLSEQLQQNTDKLFVPAAWGVPTTTPKVLQRYPSVDAYNQDNLNRTVVMAAKRLPKLDTVYIADRPLGESKPQTGRLRVNRATAHDDKTAA